MTEEEWLACSDPRPMLEFLRDKASDRKLRLFACACCRRIWSFIVGDKGRRAVEAAEEYADQACSSERLKKEWDAEGVTAVGHAIDGATAMNAEWGAAWAARNMVEAVTDRNLLILLPPSSGDIRAWATARLERKQSSEHTVRTIQATHLRDIFGNPYRPVTFDPSWRTLSVVRLAQTIYDERSFDKMPDLGDALERSGCHNEALLNHCREPGEHVRGCWVVDLALGKEEKK
jgi:hypothetical protein